MRTLSHDPFGRFSTVRKTVKSPGTTCQYCGQVRKSKKGVRFLYQYGSVNDDSLRGEVHTDGKLFCSIGCARDYRS